MSLPGQPIDIMAAFANFDGIIAVQLDLTLRYGRVPLVIGEVFPVGDVYVEIRVLSDKDETKNLVDTSARHTRIWLQRHDSFVSQCTTSRARWRPRPIEYRMA